MRSIQVFLMYRILVCYDLNNFQNYVGFMVLVLLCYLGYMFFYERGVLYREFLQQIVEELLELLKIQECSVVDCSLVIGYYDNLKIEIYLFFFFRLFLICFIRFNLGKVCRCVFLII